MLPRVKNAAQLKSRETMAVSRRFRAPQFADHDARVLEIWERMGVFEENNEDA